MFLKEQKFSDSQDSGWRSTKNVYKTEFSIAYHLLNIIQNNKLLCFRQISIKKIKENRTSKHYVILKIDDSLKVKKKYIYSIFFSGNFK